MRFLNKVCIVTGAASGIGLAVSKRLFAEGGTVLLIDLDEDALSAAADSLDDGSGRLVARAMDAADPAALRALAHSVREEHGRIDVLHCHVGIPGPAGLDIAEEEYRRTMRINVDSAFFAIGTCFPLLEHAEAGGAVVFTASTSAVVGSKYSPLYSLTKTALTGLARSVALHGADSGIRCNVVAPGAVDTAMLPKFLSRDGTNELEARLERSIAAIPLGRLVTADDVAGAVAFLASSDASMVTGHTLLVDGGMTIQ